MEKFAPSMKKAMEEREEEKPNKVPSRDPTEDLVAAEHPQPQLQREHQPPNISEMKPLTREAYGGGMYADEGPGGRGPSRPPASATQSADGPEEASMAATAGTKPNRPPPPSTGDRDLDITGLSYIQ